MEGGVRVHDWAAVRDAAAEVPPPVCGADAFARSAIWQGHPFAEVGPVLDAVESPSDGRILFAERGGGIRSLDVTDGTCRTLVAMPEGGWIKSFAVSSNGRSLAVCFNPSRDGAADPTPNEVLVWNYSRLAADAAVNAEG